MRHATHLSARESARAVSRACHFGVAGGLCALLVTACTAPSSTSAESASGAGVGGAGADQGSPPSPNAFAGGQSAGATLGMGGAGADPPSESLAGAVNAGSGTAGQGGAPGGLTYMIGIKTNGDSQGPAKVEAWLGRPLDLAGGTITTVGYITSGGGYETAAGAHLPLEVSFPLLSIFNEQNQLNDLGRAAEGEYDATYEAMAQSLAAWENPLLSARIGWEFNGDWYAWSNGVGPNATYANYVAAFRHAAIAIRKHNSRALIQWCIAWGQPDPTPYWPGAFDASNNPGGVDVISMDFYQANISHYNNADKQSTWAMVQKNGGVDLEWMVQFARTQGVKIALSEYAAGGHGSAGQSSGPGLDDGEWTADAIGWINAQPPGFFLWSDWSNDQPADDIVTAGANPREQAAWKTAWSGTHFAGGWWR